MDRIRQAINQHVVAPASITIPSPLRALLSDVGSSVQQLPDGRDSGDMTAEGEEEQGQEQEAAEGGRDDDEGSGGDVSGVDVSKMEHTSSVGGLRQRTTATTKSANYQLTS